MANEEEVKAILGGKKRFLVPYRVRDLADHMTDREYGAFMKMVTYYEIRGIEPDFSGENLQFKFLFYEYCRELDNNKASYISRSEINRRNGLKGGAPKGNQNARKAPKEEPPDKKQPKQPKQAKQPKQPKQPKQADIDNDIDIESNQYSSKNIDYSNNKTRDGIELSPPGDRLSSKPSDKPSDEEIAALQNRFMNKRRNRQSSEDREEHLRSVGFYEMTAAEKIAYLEEERRRKRANS